MMTQQSVVLELPEDLYERIRLMADTANRPVEDVIAEGLAWIFGAPSEDESLTPADLETMTDAELWTVAHRLHRQLAWSFDARLREFRERQRKQFLPEDEQERDDLVAEYDRTVFLRSKALSLLQERGHDVESHLRAQN